MKQFKVKIDLGNLQDPFDHDDVEILMNHLKNIKPAIGYKLTDGKIKNLSLTVVAENIEVEEIFEPVILRKYGTTPVKTS